MNTYNSMNDYFNMSDDLQMMYRLRLASKLESAYSKYIFDYDAFDEDDEGPDPLEFEYWLERTKEDMELLENYEGLQALKDLELNKWKLK